MDSERMPRWGMMRPSATILSPGCHSVASMGYGEGKELSEGSLPGAVG